MPCWSRFFQRWRECLWIPLNPGLVRYLRWWMIMLPAVCSECLHFSILPSTAEMPICLPFLSRQQASPKCVCNRAVQAIMKSCLGYPQTLCGMPSFRPACTLCFVPLVCAFPKLCSSPKRWSRVSCALETSSPSRTQYWGSGAMGQHGDVNTVA